MAYDWSADTYCTHRRWYPLRSSPHRPEPGAAPGLCWPAGSPASSFSATLWYIRLYYRAYTWYAYNRFYSDRKGVFCDFNTLFTLLIIHFHSMARFALDWSQLITLQSLFNEKILADTERERERESYSATRGRKSEACDFAQLKKEKETEEEEDRCGERDGAKGGSVEEARFNWRPWESLENWPTPIGLIRLNQQRSSQHAEKMLATFKLWFMWLNNIHICDRFSVHWKKLHRYV